MSFIATLIFIGSRYTFAPLLQAHGLSLILLPGQPLDCCNFKWSPDSNTITYNIFANDIDNQQVKVIYNVETNLSSKAALDPTPIATSILSIQEITSYNPFTNGKLPLVFSAPDSQWVVYPSNVSIIQDGITAYPIFLSNLTTYQTINLGVSVIEPGIGFRVLWSRASASFVIMNIVYELGAPTLKAFVTNFVNQSNKIIVYTGQGFLPKLQGREYILDGLPNPYGQPDTGVVVYNVSDNINAKQILSVVTCPHEVCGSTLTKLALVSMENSTYSEIFDGVDGATIRAASFGQSEQIIWAVTSKGLAKIDALSGKTTIVDSRITSLWAHAVLFSPNGQWIALGTEDPEAHIYIAKLP